MRFNKQYTTSLIDLVVDLYIRVGKSESIQPTVSLFFSDARMMLNVQLDILLSLNYRLTTDTPACSVLRQLNIHNAAAEQGTWSTELGVYLMPVNELKMLMLLLLLVVTGGDRHAASAHRPA